MKIQTKVRAGSLTSNHNLKKLAVKRVRGGLRVKSGVKAGGQKQGKNYPDT